MPHTPGLRTALVACLVPLAFAACDKDKLKGPEAEVRKAEVKLNLPPVPDFNLPASSDGSRSVKELRVKGKKLFESEITVKGVVTWAYDCATEVRQPGMSEKDVQKLIDEDPTKCQRAKFYIGDSADTPPEKSLWVVDVPRPYNKLEMERVKKADRNLANYPDRCEPGEKDPTKNVCPPYKVGDQVEVTGKFTPASPHSERNSDGLLVYKKMKNITQNWESPVIDPALLAPPGGAGAATPPPGGRLSPEDLVKQKK
jgi:hypothetical protein